MDNNFDGKSFVTKLGETISVKGREVTLKAKDLAEIASLRSQIKTCQDVIKKNYTEIGKLYCELHGTEPEEAYDEYYRAITNAQNAVKELEERIKDIRGI